MTVYTFTIFPDVTFTASSTEAAVESVTYIYLAELVLVANI